MDGLFVDENTFLAFSELEARRDSGLTRDCLLYTSPSPRDVEESRMPSSA